MNLLNCFRFTSVLSLILINCIKDASMMKVKFTNIQAEVYDKTYTTLKRCELKALARDTVGLYLYAQLHKLPVDNVQVNLAFFRKGNGYRPFMYNTTMDFCKFMQYPKRFMFWKILYDMFKSHTNVNHSCPFNHDLSIDGMILSADMFKLIPLPPDYYMYRMIAATNHINKAEIRFYFQIFE